MSPLYRKALLGADKVRRLLDKNMFEPLNIIDCCLNLGLTVRFVDINMEGMYVINEDHTNPTIIISVLRPFARRCFTCAHELGHHVFNHGSKIDGLSDSDESSSDDVEELLVDTFAGALLMPVAGILAEFAKRNWVPQNATPQNYYTISSLFGTGYQTLVSHCKINKIISESKAFSLLKVKPSDILKDLFSSGTDNSYFKIFDGLTIVPIIDLEVKNYIVLPHNAVVEGSQLHKVSNTTNGYGYMATKPGIMRVAFNESEIYSFIRIQNFKYVGLAQNRHLENT
jgi:Zn-dependent peptidase ImmA (M78 family)